MLLEIFLKFMEKDFKVLIAQPVAPNKNCNLWTQNCNKIFTSLTFQNKVHGIYAERVSGEGGPYARHARVRNNIISKFLKDDFTHVLWFDSDVVEWDSDIVEKLLAVSCEDVVAPYVFIEDNDWWPFKRFYDISGFRDLNGEKFDYKPPFYNKLKGDITTEVQSVGTVCLVPASFHRKIPYDPNYIDLKDPKDGIEHNFFFNQVRALGGKVIATPTIEVRHAFLPKYGENFY
jgi:hypothetical protein